MKRSSVVALLAALFASASAFAADTRPNPAPHATRLIFLGTYGGPKATKFRSEPATLLVADGTPYLIDVGPGTDRQLAWAGFRHSDVKAVFITHHHIDHDGGLVPFISLTWFEKAWHHLSPTPVGIYGPPATTYLVRSALDYLSVSERIFRAGVPALPASDGMFDAHDIEKDGPFYTDGGVRVTAAQNTRFLYSPGTTRRTIRTGLYACRFDTPSDADRVHQPDAGASSASHKIDGRAQTCS